MIVRTADGRIVNLGLAALIGVNDDTVLAQMPASVPPIMLMQCASPEQASVAVEFIWVAMRTCKDFLDLGDKQFLEDMQVQGRLLAVTNVLPSAGKIVVARS